MFCSHDRIMSSICFYTRFLLSLPSLSWRPNQISPTKSPSISKSAPLHRQFYKKVISISGKYKSLKYFGRIPTNTYSNIVMLMLTRIHNDYTFKYTRRYVIKWWNTWGNCSVASYCDVNPKLSEHFIPTIFFLLSLYQMWQSADM
jgi:hypothetical protein